MKISYGDTNGSRMFYLSDNFLIIVIMLWIRKHLVAIAIASTVGMVLASGGCCISWALLMSQRLGGMPLIGSEASEAKKAVKDWVEDNPFHRCKTVMIDRVSEDHYSGEVEITLDDEKYGSIWQKIDVVKYQGKWSVRRK
jgi:hypothetical protein